MRPKHEHDTSDMFNESEQTNKQNAIILYETMSRVIFITASVSTHTHNVLE